MENCRICAILLAAGCGSRFSCEKTKQQITINGKSVLKRSLLAFDECEGISDVVLVVKEGEEAFARAEASDVPKVRKIVCGGKTRVESAAKGFFAIDFDFDFVAVHDVARCLITSENINKVIHDAKKYGAASAASLVVDTVKRVDKDGFAIKTENRNELRLATTPQIFKRELYSKAISEIDAYDPSITDDNLLMERIGVKVYMTDIGTKNIKITYADDLDYARYLAENSNV